MTIKPIACDAILFDVDGTLLDSIPLIVETHQYVFNKHLGQPQDEAMIMASIGTPLETLFAAWPADLAQAMLDSYLAYNVEHLHSGISLFRGIPQLLASLRARGIPLGLVTSKRLISLEPSLEDFDLGSYFKIILTKESTSRHKPDAEPLLAAMRQLGLEHPERVFYVGDSIHDLECAVNAGCQPIMVGWTRMPQAPLRAAHPAIWIEQPADLLAYLEE
jgi:pyrophosphatase PpaX